MAAVSQREHRYAFVSVNGLGKLCSTDRKLIRSHCMRGKNRTIGVPRRLPPTPLCSSSSRLSMVRCRPCSGAFDHEPHPRPPLSSKAGAEHRTHGHAKGHGAKNNPYLDHEGLLPNDQKDLHEPHRITNFYTPSTLSLLHFAFDVSNEDKAFLLEFLHSFTKTMYPSTAFADYDITTCPWASWPFSDASYLQCMFFMASVIRDLNLKQAQTQIQSQTQSTPDGKAISAKTYATLRSTIILLNARLSHPDPGIALGDSTVAVVVILTIFCCMMNDHDAARAHVAGLKMLVSLRGGMEGFAGREKLVVKLSRVDLIYALNTGTQGLLCIRPMEAGYAPVPASLGSIQPLRGTICDLTDSRLLQIFTEMQHYTTLINTAHITRQRRTIAEYHSVVCSFQYRLLGLQECLNDELSECLRLAMLALLITTFQFPGTRARYPYLADCLRRACCGMGSGVGGCEIRDIMGWVLIVGAMSVWDVHTEREWMGKMWEAHVDRMEWKDMRDKMKHIMWVDVLQDDIGHIAFQQLNRLRPI
ncbi:hypothetical protein BDV06DRAFT_224441 [Aspergillus oleicola]